MPFGGLLSAIILGGGAVAGGLFGGGGASSKQIQPEPNQPIWPWMQKPFGDWLFSGFQQKSDGGWDLSGVSSYPGQLSPDVNQTRLPEAWGNWQPWDAGTMYMAQQLSQGYGQGKQDPNLAQLQRWGGPQGPGTDAMSLMMQYGAPSQAGQYAGNMAQFGMSSEGAGRPLADLASGAPSGAAKYLLPFLTAPTYKAPAVPSRTVTRKEPGAAPVTLPT